MTHQGLEKDPVLKCAENASKYTEMHPLCCASTEVLTWFKYMLNMLISEHDQQICSFLMQGRRARSDIAELSGKHTAHCKTIDLFSKR